MLKNRLCEAAVVSDVSEQCLDKARRLLNDYIQKGVLKAVCCNGLDGVENCDEVLIAGMGGEEITAILKRGYIPEKFVLQPMRNCRAVREYLLESGASIDRDTVFESGGKFYTVIKGAARGKRVRYTEAELEYGREASTAAVRRYLLFELNKKKLYLGRIPSGSDSRLESEIKLINGVLNGGS